MGMSSYVLGQQEDACRQLEYVTRLETIEECVKAIKAIPSSMSLYLTRAEAEAATGFKLKAIESILELAGSKP